MSGLDRLKGCAGTWRGTSRLHDPNTHVPEDSPSTATLTPVLSGQFIRMDYTWAYQGTPQEGSLLIGYESKADVVTAHWIDSWHMSDKVMACRGAGATDGSISVRGSYAVPPGPDWGWRTVIKPGAGGSLQVLMYNIDPDGREEMAVEANYSRG